MIKPTYFLKRHMKQTRTPPCSALRHYFYFYHVLRPLFKPPPPSPHSPSISELKHFIKRIPSPPASDHRWLLEHRTPTIRRSTWWRTSPGSGSSARAAAASPYSPGSSAPGGSGSDTVTTASSSATSSIPTTSTHIHAQFDDLILSISFWFRRR